MVISMRINSDNLFGLSKFVVDPSAADGSFITIQSAFNAAVLAGQDAVVYIKPGSYVENLALNPGNRNITIVGTCEDGRAGSVSNEGLLTLSGQGTLRFVGLTLTRAAGDLVTAHANATALIVAFSNCQMDCAAGRGMVLDSAALAVTEAFFEDVQLTSFLNTFEMSNTSLVSVNRGSYRSSNDNFCNMDSNTEFQGFGAIIDGGLIGFSYTGGGPPAVQLNYCQLSCSSEMFAFDGTGGSAQIALCLVNAGALNYATGTGTVSTNDSVFFGGTAVAGTVTVTQSEILPFATSGLSFLATTRGSSSFDSTSFTATNGFVTAVNPFLSQQITLTSAQVKTLRAAPFTLIPAPGAGKTIYVFGVQGKLVYGGSNPFTNPQDFSFNLTSGAGPKLCDNFLGATWIDQSASTYQIVSATGETQTVYSAVAGENQPLIVRNSGVSEITGNAANDNTVVITVFYRILTQ